MFTIIGATALTLCVSILSYEVGRSQSEKEQEDTLKTVDEVIAHFEEVKR